MTPLSGWYITWSLSSRLMSSDKGAYRPIVHLVAAALGQKVVSFIRMSRHHVICAFVLKHAFVWRAYVHLVPCATQWINAFGYGHVHADMAFVIFLVKLATVPNPNHIGICLIVAHSAVPNHHLKYWGHCTENWGLFLRLRWSCRRQTYFPS